MKRTHPTPSTSSADDSDRSKKTKSTSRPDLSVQNIIQSIVDSDDDESEYLDAYPDSDLESVNSDDDDRTDNTDDAGLLTQSADPNNRGDQPVPRSTARPRPGVQPGPNQADDIAVQWSDNYVPKPLGDFNPEARGPVLDSTGLNQDSTPLQFLGLFLGK